VPATRLTEFGREAFQPRRQGREEYGALALKPRFCTQCIQELLVIPKCNEGPASYVLKGKLIREDNRKRRAFRQGTASAVPIPKAQ
jgi:hypothetical protein